MQTETMEENSSSVSFFNRMFTEAELKYLKRKNMQPKL